jgi:hypothetical protein
VTLCRALGASAGEVAQMLGTEKKGLTVDEVFKMKAIHAGRLQPERTQGEPEEPAKVRDACVATCRNNAPGWYAVFRRLGVARIVSNRSHIHSVVGTPCAWSGQRCRSMHSLRLLISA